MFDHRLSVYRKLTTDEQEIAKQAIDWLSDKHLKANHIALLTAKQLDRESKTINITIEKGRLIFYRKIHYDKTPFDLYITEVLPGLKVEKWIFPNQAWNGKRPSFGFHIHIDDVENYLKKHNKKVWQSTEKSVIIGISAKELNITKTIQVGRRIALRA